MLKQNDVNQYLQIMNKSHVKTKNNKKQIMKNDVYKKTIFAHKIHEWLNYTLNDLSKLINLFDVSSNPKLEIIENEMTNQINKNKKQFDHTNAH